MTKYFVKMQQQALFLHMIFAHETPKGIHSKMLSFLDQRPRTGGQSGAHPPGDSCSQGPLARCGPGRLHQAQLGGECWQASRQDPQHAAFSSPGTVGRACFCLPVLDHVGPGYKR